MVAEITCKLDGYVKRIKNAIRKQVKHNTADASDFLKNKLNYYYFYVKCLLSLHHHGFCLQGSDL